MATFFFMNLRVSVTRKYEKYISLKNNFCGYGFPFCPKNRGNFKKIIIFADY